MKAIIESGSKQYIVEKGDQLKVELLGEAKTIEFEALAVIDGTDSKFKAGAVKVKAKVLEEIKEPKVTSIRYKAKKRVKKIQGHRQRKAVVEITSIA